MQMRLYAFLPTGIGPIRYYVMAQSLEDAYDAVEDKLIAEIQPYGCDSYDVEIYKELEIVEDGLC